MRRVAVCVVVVLAACSGQPGTGNRQPATGSREPATDNRQPATGNRQPATGTETETESGSGSGSESGSGSGSALSIDACTSDTDCEIHVGCCAHCSDDNRVFSINKRYAIYGTFLTLTFYCPSCAEGGCTISPPKRTPICTRGYCARRDVWTDPAGKVKIVEVENDPDQMELTADREIIVAAMYRACERAVACGTPRAGPCDQLKVPQHFTCDAATKCYEAIDTMTCPATFDLGVLDPISKLPACKDLDKMCAPTSTAPK